MVERRPVFLTARWRRLAMLNYEVDPELLLPHVPAGTGLDDFQGRTFVSVVGFRFLDTRLCGVPIPGHRNFDEVNLRFYVRRREGDEVRRGVVFIKEIVPRHAVTWVARGVYNEPYQTMPMRHEVRPPDGALKGLVRYQWRYGKRWNNLSLSYSGDPAVPDDDSLEAFIVEHYWGYNRSRNGGTTGYEVEHPWWRLWRAESAKLDCDVEAVYGGKWTRWLTPTPDSALLADGSEVLIRRAASLA